MLPPCALQFMPRPIRPVLYPQQQFRHLADRFRDAGALLQRPGARRGRELVRQTEEVEGIGLEGEGVGTEATSDWPHPVP